MSVFAKVVLLVACCSVQWTWAYYSNGIISLKLALSHVNNETEQLRAQLLAEEEKVEKGKQQCKDSINKMADSQKKVSEEFNADIDKMQKLKSKIAEAFVLVKHLTSVKEWLETAIERLTFALNSTSIDVKGFEEKRANNLNKKCDSILKELIVVDDEKIAPRSLSTSTAVLNESLYGDEMLMLTLQIRYATHALDDMRRHIALVQRVALDNEEECKTHVDSLLTAIIDAAGDVGKSQLAVKKFQEEDLQLKGQIESLTSDMSKLVKVKGEMYTELEAITSKYREEALCYAISVEKILEAYKLH